MAAGSPDTRTAASVVDVSAVDPAPAAAQAPGIELGGGGGGADGAGAAGGGSHDDWPVVVLL
eukprot:CAMPEP_0174727874 /NCGR_PEP_ID=MMETSP1094-20130205/50653_1 /TAXON_ID=156173 /ORGANISM="Chrysochromulina brevifilum, Strain UTEX LB 985" /LENGTH=61 /DNA_ID=CAMNT_0015929705 /DNA_START=541 /DNA_END=723 /DNA_ORIENTATION=+